ncbi:hypothetical protein AGRA3207_007463 [Actinomadura graeca]|uniref:TrbL/VirB6 plasmid conjugal transfer protein n=1 Tax=Actinomadura graeca TaxID=2750812 RepID=A0ABX8R4D1_9ACTN|nr:hypothetical protein [Actinomadura graeca]QXJ25895.1 hypothetical protein AGRA3207_007463 [Actinomadura graeca]
MTRPVLQRIRRAVRGVAVAGAVALPLALAVPCAAAAPAGNAPATGGPLALAARTPAPAIPSRPTPAGPGTTPPSPASPSPSASPPPSSAPSPSASGPAPAPPPGQRRKKCVTGRLPVLPKIPGMPDLPVQPDLPVPHLPNLPHCLKQQAGKGAGQVADAASDAVLKPLATAIAKATNSLVVLSLTGWLQLPSIRLGRSGIYLRPGLRCTDWSRDGTGPSPTTSPAPGTAAGAAPPGRSACPPSDGAGGDTGDSTAISQFASVRVHAVTTGVGTIIAALLLIVQGMRTALSRTGRHLMDAAQGLLVMAVMSAMGIALLDGLLVFSDIVTQQILGSSMGQGLGERIAAMLGLSVSRLGAGPVILFGLFIFTIALMQLVLLFLRQASIPVLAMLIPVAAAGQVGGQISRQWLIRLWASLLAIALYKPLAALIFVVGFLGTGEGQGVWDIVRGLTTLVLAIFALPALMKIFTPVVGIAVTIGSHTITLQGLVAGMGGGGLDDSGSMITSLLGGGGGPQKGAAPADPSSYARVGAGGGQAGDAAATGEAGTAGAAAVMPVIGAALAAADAAGQATTAAAAKADQMIGRAADAFTGGDSAPPRPPHAAGTGGSSTGPGPDLPIPGLDPRDDLRELRPDLFTDPDDGFDDRAGPGDAGDR